MKNITALLLRVVLLPLLLLVPVVAGAAGYANPKIDAEKLNLPALPPLSLVESGDAVPDDADLRQAWQDCQDAVSQRDPRGAEACESNDRLLAWLETQDANFPAAVILHTGAIKEMKTVLFAYSAYGSKKASKLREALLSKLEYMPYTALRFGPNPELFLTWAFQFKKECPKCTEAAIPAVMPWESLNMRTKKIAAEMLGQRSHSKQVPDLAAAKARWSAMTLAQRVRLLGTYTNSRVAKFVKGNCANSQEEKRAVRPYLSFSDSALRKYFAYEERCDLLDSLRDKNKVSEGVLDKYGKLPLGRRLQELSDYLNRTGEGDSLTAQKINEIRNPVKFDAAEIKKLSAKLKPALLEQFRATEVGRETAAYYDSGELKFKFFMEDQDSYAYFTPQTDSIVLGSSLLSVYLRTNNLTMQDMLSSKQARDGFAAFVAPAVLHEAVHHVQNTWAEKNGYPDMYNKIKEDETFSVEGLYMEQRMRSDPAFRKMVNLTKKYSAFMQEEDRVRRKFMKDPQGLKAEVDNLYYPQVTTLDGGRAEMVSSLLGELDYRASLSDAKQAQLEEKGADYETAMSRHAYNPFPYMKTSDLEEMRDLLVKREEVFEANEAQVWAGLMARRQALLDSVVK